MLLFISLYISENASKKYYRNSVNKLYKNYILVENKKMIMYCCQQCNRNNDLPVNIMMRM